MIRFAAVAALVVLLPSAQRMAKPGLAIDWQPTNAPYGGDAEAVVADRDRLLVRASGYGHERWWLSPDRGVSWQLTTGRLGDAWSIVPFEGDLLIRDFDGIHRTPDLGRSWIPCKTLPQRNRGNGSLVVAGQSIFFWNPPGLWRSRDGCNDWTAVQAPWDPDVGVVLVSARESGVLIAGTHRGWFRTDDDGQTWSRASIQSPVPVPAPSHGRTTIISGAGRGIVVGTSGGVFRSSDRGFSWSRVLSGWIKHLVVTDGRVIYAAVEGDGSSATRTILKRSNDGGSTWVDAGDGLTGHVVNDLWCDDSGTLYAVGESGVYRLAGSGRWQHIGLPTLFPTFMLAAPWGDLYLGTDYGDAFRSTDGAASWRPLLLPNRHVSSASVTKRGDLLVAAEHGVLRSRDRGDTWEPVEVDENVSTLYTVPSTGLILAGTRQGVFLSSDDGETWKSHVFPSSEPDEWSDVSPVSFAAGHNGDVFVATINGEVYQLTGERWHSLPTLDDGTPPSALVVLPSGQVLAGTKFNLYGWTPGDRVWERLPLSAEERPRITSLLMDSRGHVFAGTSVVGAFLSTDGGQSWTPANDRLPRRRIREMVLGHDGTLYAATGNNGLVYDDDAASGGRVRIFKGRLTRR
jgi:photosystem II stability/assembly factor-like uncharacterized protein